MLAVAPMDAGRSWGLHSADSSMVGTARAWIPPSLPTAVPAERQTSSPMAQSLPGPRGSLAARRRQSQAPHRRNGSNVASGSGSWKTAGGGGGGGAIVQGASSSEGAGRAGGGRRSRATAGVDSSSNSSCSSGINSNRHPLSQERGSRDEEGGSSRTSRTHGGHHRGSNNNTNNSSSSSSGGGGGGGSTSRGIAGCGEAWGAASTSVAAARTPSDRAHSGGVVSARGGKSSNAPEAWAWAGVGGGAARGMAMLSAYGLQTDKHTGDTTGDGVSRHGRWQHDQDGCGARKGESGGSAGNDGGGDRCGGVEGGGGSGQRRGRGRGRGAIRAGDTTSDRVAAGQVQKFRGGKGRKQRPSAASQGRSPTMNDRRSSEDRSASYVASCRGSSRERQRIGDAAADGCDGGGRSSGQTSTCAARAVTSGDRRDEPLMITTNATAASFDIKPGSREPAAAETAAAAVAGVDRRPAEHIQRALEDLLVRPRGSTASPNIQPGCSDVAEEDSALPTTTKTNSGHVEILSMDGRGGSAAPPYRPQQMSLRTVTSAASHAPVLPDLGIGIGTAGTVGGAGMLTAFDADSGSSSRDAVGQGSGGGGGGDDHSTPPVSRQRSHSHHSPWQARKHPRGFLGGRGGAGFGRRHHHSTNHYSHPHERSLLEERLTPGSTAGGLRSCLTSAESTETATTVIIDSSASTTAVGAKAAGTAAGASQAVAVLSATTFNDDDDNNDAATAAAAEPRGGNVPFGYSSEPRAGYGRPTSSGNTGAAAPAPPSMLGTATTPQSELIDHFKMAKRPTSRRGTRKQGGGGEGEGGEGGGGDYAPEPAFCLFSRRGVGSGGTSAARA